MTVVAAFDFDDFVAAGYSAGDTNRIHCRFGARVCKAPQRQAVALDKQLDIGTLFVSPCPDNAEVAEMLAERYGLPLWRFTNSGTEATMDAIRVARAATGRDKIVKVEGGYHGHHDEVMISMKPPLAVAGPARKPFSVPSSAGITADTVKTTLVVPYNDPEALEDVLRAGDVACFIVEPVMQNIGICKPLTGYLQAVREITQRYGTLLIFDEVKTGITSGWSGATGALGVTPDLVALAKSIGGGLPLGAFGGKREYMDTITNGQVVHLGTYNGNPLCMAAAKAVLREVCTREATQSAINLNSKLVVVVWLCLRLFSVCVYQCSLSVLLSLRNRLQLLL